MSTKSTNPSIVTGELFNFAFNSPISILLPLKVIGPEKLENFNFNFEDSRFIFSRLK